jgi:biotin carboxyl carrier protein
VELIARVGETTYALSVEAAPGGGGSTRPPDASARVVIDGRVHAVDLGPLDARGRRTLLLNGRPFDVELLAGGHVRIGDRVFAVDVDDARRFRARRAAETAASGRGSARETVAAPMPGVVVAIRVATGDLVAAGQTVAVIEAMKMQNELVAEGAGRVRDVLAQPAQVVDSGAPLVVIERDGA